MATGTGHRVEEVAQELFDVVTLIGLTTLRGRRRAGELKEIEFLALSTLQSHGTMIVGDIQRLLGVLPAQMSRIIRALENRDRPLISCRINSRDKRKVDVCLTGAGEKALVEYQAARVRRIAEMLRRLSDDEHEELSALLERVRGLLDCGPSN